MNSGNENLDLTITTFTSVFITAHISHDSLIINILVIITLIVIVVIIIVTAINSDGSSVTMAAKIVLDPSQSLFYFVLQESHSQAGSPHFFQPKASVTVS